DEQGLGQAGHAFEQHVSVGEEGDEQALDNLILTDDGLADFGAKFLGPSGTVYHEKTSLVECGRTALDSRDRRGFPKVAEQNPRPWIYQPKSKINWTRSGCSPPTWRNGLCAAPGPAARRSTRRRPPCACITGRAARPCGVNRSARRPPTANWPGRSCVKKSPRPASSPRRPGVRESKKPGDAPAPRAAGKRPSRSPASVIARKSRPAARVRRRSESRPGARRPLSLPRRPRRRRGLPGRAAGRAA